MGCVERQLQSHPIHSSPTKQKQVWIRELLFSLVIVIGLKETARMNFKLKDRVWFFRNTLGYSYLRGLVRKYGVIKHISNIGVTDYLVEFSYIREEVEKKDIVLVSRKFL